MFQDGLARISGLSDFRSYFIPWYAAKYLQEKFSMRVFVLWKQLPGIQKAFAALWAEAPETVRQAYGKGYIDSQYKAVAEQSKTSASSLAPVIDILELAIMQVNAKPRYLISGSNQIFDYLNVSILVKS